MSRAREALETRLQRAIIQESFFRLESALIISLTAALTTLSVLFNFLDFIPFWGWLLGGLVAEGVLVYSSATDPEFGRRVVDRLLRYEFQPERLQDEGLQRRMEEALEYRSRIEKAIRERDDTVLRDELNETAAQIDEWLENIYDLARKVDRYQQERDILQRDRKRAESRRAQLERKYESVQNEAVKQQIDLTLDSMNRQLETLKLLDSTIERALLQLENSLVHLGTIYTQTMLADAKNIDRSSARRMRQEIADEVTELNDLLLAMDEVYQTDLTV